MSALGNDDGALSGQMDQPSGLRAGAQGRWTWRMMMDGGGRRPGRWTRTVASNDVK